ncbi:beta-ketoacyl-ACP synthase II [Peptostreptococcus anaerobius]|uniref:beta-ketoacyl-ACP synthase II n=1 Tax=Peptostreptococcus anaerobius TaxID=1261 RepID=UPI0023300264|nr:beta-ketoacyl-ACP synthase II [Peptostreptococcus anaerobius]MDB8850483.1 beta-ketoacyl-ACP synthase II [Peptostreptococcus anaerobius]MDB8854211.1 beta-ketoacyl-ACP synthase II [Peptostreptococcus anaerobius]MDB8856074.1 beta-ketoacyl-ACP synthase II [Peptostreptococcus anaerobius]
MSRRVVITGAGVISPIGQSIEEFVESVKAGKCGIGPITSFDNTGYKTRLAAEVKDFNPKAHGVDGPKKKDRFVQFAIAAANEAMKNSGYTINEENEFRTGVVVGSGIGGLDTIEGEHIKYMEKGHKKISSHFIPKCIINMAAGHVSIALETRGVCTSSVTACATGTDSIGHAFRLVKDGYQDAVFAGGCESSICTMGVGGFEAMSALSFSDDPTRASIPFDKERSGFVMGEGSAIVLIESLDSALKRGADIICEIVGYGQTSDAHHITAPNPDGKGAANAMLFALEEAGVDSNQVDYINAHGTSTQLNDVAETNAIKLAFKDHSKDIMVSSTKSMTGHMLGAAGAIEAIVCAYALKDGFVPQTINYKVKDEECDLDYVTDETRKRDIEYAISNSLGFGGHNASLLLKKYKG